MPIPDDRGGRPPAAGWGRYPEVSVHRLFEQQAARTPDLAATVAGPDRMTYRQLDARANQLAHHLRARGVGPETLVALGMTRSPALITGLLAILKAGGAYLPLDPAYPPDRVAFMLDDARVPLMLTEQPLLSRWPAHSGRTVCLDLDSALIDRQPETAPAVDLTLDQLAYVIYTSGSTGQPKGVAMPHRPISNLSSWQIGVSGLPPGSMTLQLAPASFDVSVQEIFSTLCGGGTLVLIEEDDRHDPRRLLQVIQDAPVARLFLTFTALQQLAEVAGSGGSPKGLREVVTAGEQLRITPAIARWFETLPGLRLCNQYGPTETHVVMTHFLLEGPAGSWPALPPIGKAIPNTYVYLLDDELRPVPPGEVGEIVIGGDCLARGYLNRPALTAERFLPDPFRGAGSARMYRSGDFGRFLDDGNIAFVGRRDRQVKVRGFRVELGEVEAALDQYPDLVRTAVAVHEPEPGDRRLVAYVEARPGRALSTEALRRFLLQTLPVHMVPAIFVQLETLPLSPSGKIDRMALPPPPKQRQAAAGPRVPPASPFESRLVSMWQEVLGSVEIGVTDNFYSAGGDSLKAVRLLARIESELGRQVSYAALSGNPTIQGLAALLDQMPVAEDMNPAGVRRDDHGGAPATAEQEAMWFAGQMEPGRPVFNETFAVHFNARVDPVALEKALHALIRRHEVLRTVFGAGDEWLEQHRVEDVPAALTVVSLSGGPPDEAWPAMLAAVEPAARLPLDPARAPLLRAILVCGGGAGDVLFLVMHHLIIDAYGLYYVLMPELATMYTAYRTGLDDPALPRPPLQFAGFARWQRSRFAGAHAERLRAFWKEQLAGLRPIELPADRPRPPTRGCEGACLFFSLPETVTSDLKSLAARQGVSFFSLLVAAFNVLLRSLTGEDDIAILTMDSGRTRPEHETLLGCCVNSLILRNRVDDGSSFLPFLARVHDSTAAAFEHRGLPLREVRALLGGSSALPLPLAVAFVMEPAAPTLSNGWRVIQHEPQTGTTKFDLIVEVEERSSQLTGCVTYATGLFERPRVETWMRLWQTLLEELADNPDVPVARLASTLGG